MWATAKNKMVLSDIGFMSSVFQINQNMKGGANSIYPGLQKMTDQN